MKKNIINNPGFSRFFLSAILICCLFLSCSKMVDVDLPNNQVTAQAAFINNDQATAVIAGIYSQLMTNTGSSVFSNGGVTLYTGLSSDELESYMGVSNSVDYAFYTNKLLRDNTVPATILWTPAYKVIFSCNAAISGIAESTSVSLDAATRSQLTAEAKFIRALSYFYLVNLFGEVPMPLVTDFNQTASLTRSPAPEIYQQIISDLKDAKASLPANFSFNPSGERIRANNWAAAALLARAYLYTGDWAAAEAQASEVIASPLFATGSLDNLFLKNSTETILALKQNITKIPYGGTHDANAFIPSAPFSGFPLASQNTLLSNAATYSSSSLLFFPNYNMTAQLAAAFEAGDLRRSRWTLNWPSPNLPPYNGRTFYTPYKYKVRAGSSTTPNTEYYIVLRISEQYLIRAEARAKQGNLAGAASDLLPLRTRAGLGAIQTNSQEQVLEAIAHERQVELFCEWGHRWMDLKRTGKATAVLSTLTDKQPWSNTQLLYPIPPMDINNNPKLIQNPGYE